MELTKQLEALQADQTKLLAKLTALETGNEQANKQYGEHVDELKKITARMDEIDMKLVVLPSAKEVKTLGQLMKESDAVQRMMKNQRGQATLSLDGKAAADFLSGKATITSSTVGFPTAGVMPEERGAYVPETRTQLRMRDVIPSRPTVLQQISWPVASNTGTKASPVAEANLKPANNYQPTMDTERVKTIATYFDAGRQVLEDWTELEGILRSLGTYKVQKEYEAQILSGNNVGENFNGLITQAASFTSSLLPASSGYTYIDVLGAAFQQIDESDEVESDFAVLHKGDWWKIRRLKDSQGKYLLGDPQSPVEPTLWGRRVVPTNQITKGTFLTGSSSPAAAEIRDRMGIEIVLSTEHNNNFTYNLVTIRFEMRGCLCVYRPDAFVSGSFIQSPA